MNGSERTQITGKLECLMHRIELVRPTNTLVTANRLYAVKKDDAL